MLDARRYRSAAAHLGALLAEQPAVRYREAPLPPHLRRSSLEDALGRRCWEPADARSRARRAARAAAEARPQPHRAMRVSVAERVAHLRALLRSAVALSFDDAVRDADRMTVAVTLLALLELLQARRGELGAGRAVRRDHRPRARRAGGTPRERARADRRGAAVPRRATRSASAELAEVDRRGEQEVVGRRSRSSPAPTRRASAGLLLREVGGRLHAGERPDRRGRGARAAGQAAPRAR